MACLEIKRNLNSSSSNADTSLYFVNREIVYSCRFDNIFTENWERPRKDFISNKRD